MAPENTGSTGGVAQVLSSCREVAVLPQVVYKIVELTGASESSAATMERAIIVDPGFSAKILSQANSAYYALPRKVTSIREAVMFLGFKAVRQLAMAVGVFDLFVGKTDKESLRRRAWWRHSIDSALCCRVLAESTRAATPDVAYTCGLLHYVGKTLMDRSAPQEYGKVMMLIDAGAGDLQAERAVFKCDHVEVALGAAAKWGFPEVLVGGINYVNAPDADDPHAKLRAITALSNAIAKVTMSGQTDGTPLRTPEWVLAILGLAEADVEKLVAIGIDAIVAGAKMAA